MEPITGVTFARPEALLLLPLLGGLAIYQTLAGIPLALRTRRMLSLFVRLALITLLVLAFSEVSVTRANNSLSVVFLLDRSDSINEAGKAAEAAYLRDALGQAGANDQAGVVMFGRDALVERSVEQSTALPDLSSTPQTSYSNIDAAIRLALGIAPTGTARRLVLLSDGLENMGSAAQAARLAWANGVPLDVVPLPVASGPEVSVDALHAPATVRQGEEVSLSIEVSSSTDTTATLLLLADGAMLSSGTVSLTRGSNTFVQNIHASSRGFHNYSAQVLPPPGTDTRPENNHYSAYSMVLGKSRLLVVEGHPGEAGSLVTALSPSSDTNVVPASAMTTDLQSLASYDAIVMVNVPASSLSQEAMVDLSATVRDLGKGLVVVGGDESYAAGGYFRTPLEAMLPVSLNLPSKLEIPSVGMVLVIDRSGSMDESHTVNGSGVKKIELAKEAAYSAVAQLSERDYVGVVTFDSEANWAVPFQPMGSPDALSGRIRGVTSGGGTNIYAGLAPAVYALTASKARSRHIVLLTDGQSEGGDYAGLLKEMQSNNITLSTVAIGADADKVFLDGLAKSGGGRSYYSEQGDSLPQIFAHESHLASRSYLIEHPFTPQRAALSPMVDGLGTLPILQGYVGTSEKAGGQVSVVSGAGDPLLAEWQYGLGRVVAWTSDAKGQWARDWIGWNNFSRFWSQVVRWSTGTEGGATLQPRVELAEGGGAAHVTVDAQSADGSFLNGLSPRVIMIGPGQITSTVELRQSAAGRYEGSLPIQKEGTYLLQVSATSTQIGDLTHTIGLTVPYSPEYASQKESNGKALLDTLAQENGGKVLLTSDTKLPFRHDLPLASSSIALWPLLLLLGILLLPLDIGVRRLALSWAELAGMLRWVSSRIVLRTRSLPRANTDARAITGLEPLLVAKQRAQSLTQPTSRGQLINSVTQAQDLQPDEGPGLDVSVAESAKADLTEVIEPDNGEDDGLASRLR
ncbi:MAG: VWA domain-containing protein, partial [Chloroflexota bacterium]|nr:VWA domain-containing protein [Chloroflexota bacterium]